MGFRSKEIDLHGLFADEVEYVLSNAFTDCKAYGISNLNIIYGKGEGILRQKVHSVLAKYQKIIVSTKSYEANIQISLKLQETIVKNYKKKSLAKTEEKKNNDFLMQIRMKKQKGKEKYSKRMKVK